MGIIVRRLTEADDIDGLTSLLHRAYAELAALGFRYTATYQSSEVTRSRCEGGTCLVAEVEGVLAGTVTFYDCEQTCHAEWYDRPEVASFGQFAVDPGFRGNGVGRVLMDSVEGLALSSGAREIACDTAEGATHLIELYNRRGYRIVGRVDWRDTNYVSVVLSKELLPQA